jgi:hypothetical protein
LEEKKLGKTSPNCEISKLQIQNRSDIFGGFQKVREKKKIKNCQIFVYLVFMATAKRIQRMMIKQFLLHFWLIARIWLNLPLHDHHFGYKQKILFLKKTAG